MYVYTCIYTCILENTKQTFRKSRVPISRVANGNEVTESVPKAERLLSDDGYTHLLMARMLSNPLIFG